MQNIKQCTCREELEEAVKNERMLFMLQMNFKRTFKRKLFGMRKVEDECTAY